MNPYVFLFNRDIPAYGIAYVTAVFAGIIFALHRRKKYGANTEDTLFMGLYAVIGGLIGAKCLYVITITNSVIKYRDIIKSDLWNNLYNLLIPGGFVFFWGLIGGILAALYYLRKYRLEIPVYADIFAPCIPLAHAIGRMGCFFAGCCYGIESSHGIEFNLSLSAPHGVRLFPVQLMEAGINVLIMITLLVYERNQKGKGQLLLIYLFLYSAARFVLEFWRGDLERGFIFGLSTSQIIASVLFFISICLIIYYNHTSNSRKCHRATDTDVYGEQSYGSTTK